MEKKNLEKILTYSGSAILAGAAIYLNKDNKKIRKKYEKARKELLEIKENLGYFLSGLKKMHKKYVLLNDELLEHIKVLKEDIPELKELDMDHFSERFPEKDIQFFTPDMLMSKISGLVDAFILNRWSIFPKEEKKKIPKQFLTNKKSLDIYSRNDISLVLSKLKIHKMLEINDQNFILGLFDYFKEPVLIKGEIVNYKDDEINYYYKYMINMIIRYLE